jgi:four helix bundle protein
MGKDLQASSDLKLRTKQFALSILAFLKDVKWSLETDVLKKQIIRSATSVGAIIGQCAGQNRERILLLR